MKKRTRMKIFWPVVTMIVLVSVPIALIAIMGHKIFKEPDTPPQATRLCDEIRENWWGVKQYELDEIMISGEDSWATGFYIAIDCKD